MPTPKLIKKAVVVANDNSGRIAFVANLRVTPDNKTTERYRLVFKYRNRWGCWCRVFIGQEWEQHLKKKARKALRDKMRQSAPLYTPWRVTSDGNWEFKTRHGNEICYGKLEALRQAELWKSREEHLTNWN